VSAGVVYFVDPIEGVWHCIPRQEIRRVRRSDSTDSGVYLYVLMSFGVDLAVRLSNVVHGAVSYIDMPDPVRRDAIGAMVASLTSSVDTDVTWTRVGPHGNWQRSESRPQ
jgi:hypothetical protein